MTEFQWGEGGCICASCKATNAHIKSGFSVWPKGDPAGRKAQAVYSQHVAMSRYGSIKRPDFGPAGIGFYGVPVGSRADAERVLAATFQECAP